MVAAKPLEKEITHYLKRLNTHQKEVVLSVVKTFAGNDEECLDDKEFISEMDRRYEDLASGKDKGITVDQLESRIRKAYKTTKRNTL